MKPRDISKAALKRLPTYLTYLKAIPRGAPPYISATALAAALNLGEVQVRKDLAMVSNGGRPKVGYLRKNLIADLEYFLGCHHTDEAVLVGAGKLGRALIGHKGFGEYGLKIVAAFDADEALDGQYEGSTPIYSISRLEDFCKDHRVLIGIITVPGQAAQSVCNLLVKSGVKAIWSFAPTFLEVPPDILVQYEDMAASMAVLSVHLAAEIHRKEQA